MLEPKNNEILLRKQDNGLFVSVPDSMIPELSNWVGRLQSELDKPFEMPDVVLAYVMATNKLRAQDPPHDEESHSDDEFFELLKAEAITVFDTLHKTPDRNSKTGEPDDIG